MTAERRRPLSVGCRVRHIDGREGQLLAVSFNPDNPIYCAVSWDVGGEEWILPGYLEALSADKLTA